MTYFKGAQRQSGERDRQPGDGRLNITGVQRQLESSFQCDALQPPNCKLESVLLTKWINYSNVFEFAITNHCFL